MAKVRFEWDERKAARFVSLEQDTGVEGEISMKKRIKYANEPLQMEVLEDFLPPPEDLVLKQDTVKVTIGLSQRTVEFFKARARQNQTQYQKMIRRLLDLYAARYR